MVVGKGEEENDQDEDGRGKNNSETNASSALRVDCNSRMSEAMPTPFSYGNGRKSGALHVKHKDIRVWLTTNSDWLPTDLCELIADVDSTEVSRVAASLRALAALDMCQERFFERVCSARSYAFKVTVENAQRTARLQDLDPERVVLSRLEGRYIDIFLRELSRAIVRQSDFELSDRGAEAQIVSSASRQQNDMPEAGATPTTDLTAANTAKEAIILEWEADPERHISGTALKNAHALAMAREFPLVSHSQVIAALRWGSGMFDQPEQQSPEIISRSRELLIIKQFGAPVSQVSKLARGPGGRTYVGRWFAIPRSVVDEAMDRHPILGTVRAEIPLHEALTVFADAVGLRLLARDGSILDQARQLEVDGDKGYGRGLQVRAEQILAAYLAGC